jgi:hypothetical protein
VFAIPDHPWVDASDGAAVRIAMTVAEAGEQEGVLQTVRSETDSGEDARSVELTTRRGKIHADLTAGANVAGAKALVANSNLSNRGVSLFGGGFIVSPSDAIALGLGAIPGLEKYIRQYRNGRDLTQSSRGVLVIDLFGLTVDEVRHRFPTVYQWVLERVKPERDQNNRASYRDHWWIFGESRRDWRAMSNGLPRYIATVETAKHRLFQFLDADILPDNMLVNIAIDNGYPLGVLSSRIHVIWALATGGRLGMGNDPRYNKTRCFETFPFPDAMDEQAARIRDLAEQIDAHRKRQQVQHSDLTLTGMYNVLEKLRTGELLTSKEKVTHQQGLISILRELHDDLDRAVFAAYGWNDLADELVGKPGATTPLPDKPAAQLEAEEELLRRLVDLNTQRAAEEAQGHIRWLRPAYQNPEARSAEQSPAQQERMTGLDVAIVPEPIAKCPWPKAMREQVAVIRELLTLGPRSEEQLAARFQRKPVKAVSAVLEALEAMNLARREEGRWRLG